MICAYALSMERPSCTDHLWQALKLTDIGCQTKQFCHLIAFLGTKRRWRDNAGPVPIVCIYSSYESSSRSVGRAAYYQFDLCNTISKCTCIKYVSSHVINYQQVSIASAIIIGKNTVLWKCLKLQIVPLTHFCSLLYFSTLVMLP